MDNSLHDLAFTKFIRLDWNWNFISIKFWSISKLRLFPDKCKLINVWFDFNLRLYFNMSLDFGYMRLLLKSNSLIDVLDDNLSNNISINSLDLPSLL